MNILVDSDFLTKEQIKDIEEKYAATYVFEACIKDAKGKWLNFPAAIFYTNKAHPEGSNYFAMFMLHGHPMIADGITAVENVLYTGLEAEDQVVYSRYRHDFRSLNNGAYIDGGRDYFRYGGDSFNDYNVVRFKVVKDRLEIVNG